MSFLLDTDICSRYLRNVPAVCNRFLQYAGRLHVSVVTVAELEIWVLRQTTPLKYKNAYPVMLGELMVLDLDQPIAHRAGDVGAELRDKGRPMATPDLLIAATALIHALTLVTHNGQDYAHVPGLSVLDWAVP